MARLNAELERMKVASPAAVLRLTNDAGATTTRAAFLAMVKEFHPHRYARESAEVQQLANEIFLRIKEAYDTLCSEPAPPRRRSKGSTSPPPQPARPNRAVRFKKTARRPKTPRPAPSPLRPPRAPTPAAGVRVRRPSDHSSLVAALETEEEQRTETFREGLKLLKAGRPAEARELFRELAVNKPAEKKYRVYMHYAWGREHQAAGRYEQAAAELRRSLKLDPQFSDAVEALDEVAAAESSKQAGVFGRLFRRSR